MPSLNKTKIPQELEKEIYNLYISGTGPAQLANKYGCSKGNIYKICKRNGPMKYLRPDKSSKMKCNENYFETIDTPDKSYFLGFLIADGHISKDKDIKIRLNVNDIEILEKFNKYLESEYKIQKSSEFDKRTNKTYELCSLLIYKHKLCEDLAKLGVTNNKSTHILLPQIPEHLIKFMIRGICDGDGGFCINDKNTCSFKLTSSTKLILEQIQDILMKECGINKTVIVFDTGCYRFTYGGNDDVRKIYNYLYSDLQEDLYLTRKYLYIKTHLDNLDKGIITRNPSDPPVSQYR